MYNNNNLHNYYFFLLTDQNTLNGIYKTTN